MQLKSICTGYKYDANSPASLTDMHVLMPVELQVPVKVTGFTEAEIQPQQSLFLFKSLINTAIIKFTIGLKKQVVVYLYTIENFILQLNALYLVVYQSMIQTELLQEIFKIITLNAGFKA